MRIWSTDLDSFDLFHLCEGSETFHEVCCILISILNDWDALDEGEFGQKQSTDEGSEQC